MKRVLCYGDSNTWGYVSGSDHQRYGENERWTKLLQKTLAADFEIIEEGLSARTLCSDDNRPGKEGRNGFTYLKPCLETHDKIDIVILMLGTNELKNTFNHSAKDIVSMLEKYVVFIQNKKSQIDGSVPEIVISGLPLVKEATAYVYEDDKYRGTSKKSEELNELYKRFCERNGLIYVDNNDLEVGVDCVHLTKESHAKLAKKLAEVLKDNFS